MGLRVLRRLAHPSILPTSPRMRVPHPCVLCKGGNHRRINLEHSGSVPPTLSHMTRKDGAPSAGILSTETNSGAERLGDPPMEFVGHEKQLAQDVKSCLPRLDKTGP
jgi:hypothetical protein